MNVTRDQVYMMVWGEPVTKVAKRLGLSDRGLAKLCARYDIPVPPRGYWARRQAGYTDDPTPLPEAGTGAIPVVIQQATVRPTSPALTLPPEVRQERQPENPVLVADGRPRHHLVRAASAALRGAKPDDYGRLPGGRGVLEVCVSKGALARALSILDALLLAMEARGHQVHVREGKTRVVVHGEPIEFRIDERTIRREKVLTAKEQLELDRGGWVFGRYSYQPSGELSLHLKNIYRVRHKWSDRKTLRLEEQLNDIPAGLETAAEAEKVSRLERERREQEWQAAEARREKEAERIRNLDEWASQWERCERYRAFLAAARRHFEGRTISDKLLGWFAWADNYVQSIDPLRAASGG